MLFADLAEQSQRTKTDLMTYGEKGKDTFASRTQATGNSAFATNCEPPIDSELLHLAGRLRVRVLL